MVAAGAMTMATAAATVAVKMLLLLEEARCLAGSQRFAPLPLSKHLKHWKQGMSMMIKASNLENQSNKTQFQEMQSVIHAGGIVAGKLKSENR
jgi:hypothetical protein